ncbi:hypothetical protein EDEG_02907 [Edhazardia aedis USNM 41457]|uniref:Uncharacterized protein n=1 Tax=Edhazardia aedis (strain USNM 41457) TaxID=1003232 RepID=J9DJB2_EDHAE|nr:hypothetical protein EDEG_02907 [Edhazardia aedis USNM 41457]|eukprot:EJW02695.1 hypothetical protein EDEG_02907 [Edhazardia aedis USNM 41457]
MKDSSEIDIKFGKFSLKGRSVLKDRTNLNDLNLQVDYSEKLNKILGKNKKIESSRVIGKKSYGKAKYFEMDRESNSRQKNSFLKLDKYDYGNVNNKIGTPEYRNEQSEIYTEHSYDDSILENQENTRKTRKKSKFYLEKQLYDSNSSENIENIEINRFNGLRLYLKNIESPSLHVKNKKKFTIKKKEI